MLLALVRDPHLQKVLRETRRPSTGTRGPSPNGPTLRPDYPATFGNLGQFFRRSSS